MRKGYRDACKCKYECKINHQTFPNPLHFSFSFFCSVGRPLDAFGVHGSERLAFTPFAWQTPLSGSAILARSWKTVQVNLLTLFVAAPSLKLKEPRAWDAYTSSHCTIHSAVRARGCHRWHRASY